MRVGILTVLVVALTDKCTIRRTSGGCERGPGSNRDFFIYYPPD